MLAPVLSDRVIGNVQELKLVHDTIDGENLGSLFSEVILGNIQMDDVLKDWGLNNRVDAF